MNNEEDIRSMLAKRAKVPPRDNSLKLGNSSKRTSHLFPNGEEFGETSYPVSLSEPANRNTEEEAQLEETKLSSSPITVDSVIPSVQNSQAEQVSHLDDPSSLSTNDVNHLEAELEKLPKTGKRLAIHLEEEVRNELIAFCDRHELTPEVFLEAIFVNFQLQYEKTDSKKLAKVVADAKERLAKRKKVGLLKRTLSIINKIKK